MRTYITTALLLSLLIFSTHAFGQGASGSIAGAVFDPSGALIPGVSITATNLDTGVVATTLTNEAGVYNFTSIQPGKFKVTASLTGFQTAASEFQLGIDAVRLNFTMKVGAAGSTTVDVTLSVDTQLAQSSPSIGEVLSQQRVVDLPLVSNNVLDLIGTMSGVNVTNSPIFGANATTFAGLDATNINVRVNGVTANAGGRYPTGVQTATMINPDMVGEIKLILTPIDAESGDGNGQIQIQTRSGTNKYTGSTVFYTKNTALNANTWQNNRVQPAAIQPDWSNVNEVTASYGGPIIKNKTFFFALYDGLFASSRTSTNATVLTPCARNGIFRYWNTGASSGTNMWNNGNILQVTTAPGNATPTIASVDFNGNPLQPTLNPDGTSFAGALSYVSVFGPLLNTPTAPDCSDAIVSGSPWDPFRTGVDTTGFVTKLNGVMPLPNNYEIGDGLNTAGIRWVRTIHGSDNLFGIGENTERNQFNVKIDHNISDRERLNFSVQYERSHGDDVYPVWPNGFGGSNFRHPIVLTGQGTSTLSSTMVNVATLGYSETGGNVVPAFNDSRYSAATNAFYNLSANGIPLIPLLGTGGVNFQFNQMLGNRGIWPAQQYDKTPLTSISDTLSWSHGTHSFKVGGEGRFARSLGATDGGFGAFSSRARATGGDTLFAPIATATIGSAVMPGLGGTATTGNNARVRNLLDYLSGSLSTVTEFYYLDAAGNPTWQDYTDSPVRKLDYHQNSFDLFFKDDWKIHKDLTLNLGMRYEYYGVPFVGSGLTVAPAGGGYAMFGISGRDGFSDWMTPGSLVSDPNLLTTLQFVGPQSSNPKLSVWPNDWNNFGPAAGFAWQVPFFGEGKTTVRGGYQITYQGTVQVNTLDAAIGNAPGTINNQTYAGDASNPYLSLATALSSRVPVPITVQPMQAVPIGSTGVTFNVYDPNYATPYVQNFTLSVARNVARNLSVDVRYVGNMAVKQNKSINLNTNNFLYNGLKEQFDSIRAGGESPMLDSMFAGINIAGAGFGPIGTTLAGVPQTAALQMRASATFNSNLANGNYNAVAGSIATLSYNTAFNPTLPAIPNGQQVGDALRNSGLFPANFIQANPQFTTATYNTNLGHTNYHSLEVQTTYRPIKGVSWQGTYTWSKNLGTPATFTNPVDRSVDGYQLLGANPKHQFRSNGSVELPIGPDKLLFGSASGTVARILEHWQSNFIFNASSGVPTTITGASMLYANGRPDIVSSFPYDLKGVTWNNGAPTGSYFPAGTFGTVKDPQCATVGGPVSFQNLCTLQALTDSSSGKIILQNALPGKQGTLGVGTLETPGTWTLDANLGKSFRISESKSVQIRLDATNILNHASPTTSVFGAPASPPVPILSLAAGAAAPFGIFNTKTANARVFQGQIRINF